LLLVRLTAGDAMGFLDWFRAGSRQPNAFEDAILDQVQGLLSPDDARRFALRRKAINLVQRHGGGQEVNLYQRRGGKVVFPPETAVVGDPASIDFAEVETRSQDPMSRLRAVVGLHEGNLASIEFNRPTEHADTARVEEMRARLLGPPFRNPDDDRGDGWPEDR